MLKDNLHWVAWLVKTILTDEDKRILRGVASELLEIRKSVEEIAETLVKLSDKEFLNRLNANQDDIKENQVDNYQEKLEKQIEIAKKEVQS